MGSAVSREAQTDLTLPLVHTQRQGQACGHGDQLRHRSSADPVQASSVSGLPDSRTVKNTFLLFKTP